jgi:putative alpha-1,2-mannosidase
MKSQYADGPGGLAGNDDAGQMSAWYVLSALGWYEVCPGVPEYWIGSPSFDRVEVQLPGKRTLRIVAQGAESGKEYVERVELNGQPVRDWKLTYDQIMQGGDLVYVMSDVPPANTVSH